LNTVFFEMAVDRTGTGKVADSAKDAGITADLSKARLDGNISIGGGNTMVSTLDMASAYATFATNGIYRAPHLVAKVLNPDGSVVYSPQQTDKQAFDSNGAKNAKIARNVTESLLPVAKYSNVPCANDRLCAAKSGTHQYGDTKDNEKAWFVGYTPQISAAVSMTAEPRGPIRMANGKVVFGASLPGPIWKKFMDSYHKLYNLPKLDFGKFTPIGKGFVDNGDNGDGSSSSQPPGNNPGQPTTTTTDKKPDPPTKTTTTTTTTSRTRPTIPTIPNGSPQQAEP